VKQSSARRQAQETHADLFRALSFSFGALRAPLDCFVASLLAMTMLMICV